MKMQEFIVRAHSLARVQVIQKTTSSLKNENPISIEYKLLLIDSQLAD